MSERSNRSKRPSTRTSRRAPVPIESSVAAAEAPPSVEPTERTHKRREKRKEERVEVVPSVSQVLEPPASEVAAELPAESSTLEPVSELPVPVGTEPYQVVEEQFNDILRRLEIEAVNLRKEKKGSLGPVVARSLKDVARSLKKLKTLALKSMKKRKKRTNTGQNVSGFSKPVSVSKEMASFAGWDESELHSRNDVTSYICKYVREHNLQNPENRRVILPDKHLTKLLDYKEGVEAPLTYTYLQTKIQPHFLKT